MMLLGGMIHPDSSLITLFSANTTANATSEAFNRANYIEHAIQVEAANATSALTLQVSVDQVAWVDHLAITGSNFTNLSGCFPWVRGKRSASGNTTAALTLKMYSISAVDV